MTKQKDEQIRELQRESDKWYDKYVTWCIISFVFILGFMVLLLYFLPLNENYKDLNKQLESCQEKAYCSDTFRNSMSDSCVLGCIYSTKFYYDNPRIDFKESSYDCMLNCLEKAQDIQDKFSFCEVIE